MSINPPFLLENMPEEVLLNILKQGLDITDLKAVRALGRFWCNFVSDNELWQNIAIKIKCILYPQIDVFFDVKMYVQKLLHDAKFHNVSYLADSFLRNWVFRNFKSDADVTIGKIRKLIVEIEKQEKWDEIHLIRFGCIHRPRSASGCIRSSTPGPSMG
ncbi:MAG: hypothetical protein K1060chlam1_00061 [Candidatus Anoxychlamydiales bacterium]|nr:hypothetical protein [Candidatus Anoxychlamydiales bacterium]